MKALFSRTATACAVVCLACSLAACAAVEKQAAKTVAESAGGALKSVLAKSGTWLRRGGVAAGDALERQMASWALKGDQRVVFKALETVRPRIRWRVVRRDVKAFVRAFEQGAREPDRYFNDPLADPALVKRWKATPRKDRVFVAGAQEDTAVVEALRAQLEREGKTVFFYRFCSGTAALCDSKTVGAFFGTAGSAVLAVTEATSRFLPHEVESGVRLAAGRSELVILTPEEAVFNAAVTRVVQGTAEAVQAAR